MSVSVKELLSEALPIIEENAPTIATAIASPIIGLPELALSVLAEAFGRHVTQIQPLLDDIKNDKSTPNHDSASSALRAIQEEHGDNFKKVMNNRTIIYPDDNSHKFTFYNPSSLIEPTINEKARKITITIDY